MIPIAMWCMAAEKVEEVGSMLWLWSLRKYGWYADDMRYRGAQRMSIVTIKAIYP